MATKSSGDSNGKGDAASRKDLRKVTEESTGLGQHKASAEDSGTAGESGLPPEKAKGRLAS